jgi:glyoxalase family protein
MRQSGRKGRKGAGQITELTLSVPVSGLPYWGDRLRKHGLTVRETERFGARMLTFEHPCGIAYALAGVADDDRKPRTGGGVPSELGIRGTCSIAVATLDRESMHEFLRDAWSARHLADDAGHSRFGVDCAGPGRFIDVHHGSGLSQGSWTFGEGTVHHCAFQVAGFEEQDAVKARLEALGFTDVSERKDRGYFDSVYVRSPAGALFEATVSKPEGFLIDEPFEQLGSSFQVPPVFAGRRREILEFLEPLETSARSQAR